MIYGIIGDCGCGKTLLMSMLLLKDHLKGKEVYCNYKLRFDSKILTQAFFKNYKDFPVFDCTIGFDELSIYYSSRNSMSKINKQLRPFILQTRKRSLKLYYTTQQERLVDINIRENTDGLFFPEIWILNIHENNLFQKPEDYEIEQGDVLFLQVKYYKKVNEGWNKVSDNMIRITDENGQSKFFDIYDTYEIIDFEDGATT